MSPEEAEHATRTPPAIESDTSAAVTARFPGSRSRTFGPFVLHERIGRGGLGEVYRATGPEGEVALKVLRAGEEASEAEIRSFRREAEVARRLRHPGLMPILSFGRHDGQLFYTMPLITGGNLERRLKRGGLDLEQGVRVLARVARAMDFAHRGGVLHRDLKPANILLDGDEPRVADFGLARFVDHLSCHTVTGQIMGSLPYMSPEQAGGHNHRTTGATDIWSLCVILYELLAGQRPFQGATTTEMLHRIQHEPPERPSVLKADVPPALEIICLRGLHKNPRRRYPTMAALASDLEGWIASREGGTELTTLSMPGQTDTRPTSRFWGLGAIVGALFLAALALVPISRTTEAPPVSPEDRFLQIVSLVPPGKSLVLAGAARPVRWSRVVAGADLAKTTQKPGQPLWVNTPGTCLLEWLPPDPRRGDYRLTITLSHEDGEGISQVGLYAGRSEFHHPEGVGHTLLQATFCEPELIEGGVLGRKNPPRETRVVLADQYYNATRAGLVLSYRVDLAGLRAGAVKSNDGLMRTFALEVRQDSVSLVSGGKKVTVPHKMAVTYFPFIARSCPELAGKPLNLLPTGGAGLVVHRGSVSVHRVLYEPLPRP